MFLKFAFYKKGLRPTFKKEKTVQLGRSDITQFSIFDN